jgi:hypothetical protein
MPAPHVPDLADRWTPEPELSTHRSSSADEIARRCAFSKTRRFLINTAAAVHDSPSKVSYRSCSHASTGNDPPMSILKPI